MTDNSLAPPFALQHKGQLFNLPFWTNQGRFRGLRIETAGTAIQKKSKDYRQNHRWLNRVWGCLGYVPGVCWMFLSIVQNLSVLMGFLVIDVDSGCVRLSGLAPDGNVQPVADIYQQWLKNSNAFSKCGRKMSCGYSIYIYHEHNVNIYIYVQLYVHIHTS